MIIFISLAYNGAYTFIMSQSDLNIKCCLLAMNSKRFKDELLPLSSDSGFPIIICTISVIQATIQPSIPVEYTSTNPGYTALLKGGPTPIIIRMKAGKKRNRMATN